MARKVTKARGNRLPRVRPAEALILWGYGLTVALRSARGATGNAQCLASAIAAMAESQSAHDEASAVEWQKVAALAMATHHEIMRAIDAVNSSQTLFDTVKRGGWRAAEGDQ